MPYTYRTYAPVIGEPGLRRALGRWTGNVSVPVLLVPEGTPIPDSTEIARWADAHGAGTLFPAGRAAELEAWLGRAERGLNAGRALSLRRVLLDPDAQKDLVPKPLRGALGKLGGAVAGLGVRRTLRKYDAPDDATANRDLDAALEALRAALSSAPDPAEATILGGFSYADIAMAQVLVFVKPPTAKQVRIGHGSRRAFTDPDRCVRYADLLTWRDALYARYRDAAASKAT